MVRKYDASGSYDASLPSRKFVLSKHATTVALDVRNIFRSVRGPRLVLGLIAAPFVVALLLAIVRGSANRGDAQHVAAVPGWEKYGYDEIRAGESRKSRFRATVRLKSYLKLLQSRRKYRVDPARSISLIAACKNRKKSLGLTLPAWDAVKEIDEIVLVDWGSDSDQWEDLPLLDALVRTGRVSFVRVEDAGDWVLSRAYNLAAKFTMGKYILRVDCDTHLNPDFIRNHPRPAAGQYYTVGWGTERNENEQKLRSVWLALKQDFVKVGGYDERITDYGYEDADLYERFQAIGKLQAKFVDLDTLKHSIVGHLLWEQEASNKISTRMNQAIIRSALPWPAVYNSGQRMEYTYSYSQRHLSLYAKITKTAPDPLEGKSDHEREELQLDVLQKALHDEYDIPWDILPSLSLDDLEYLAGYLDDGTARRVVVVCLDGLDTISNVFNLVSALQLGLATGRPVIAIWRGPNGSEVNQSDGAVIKQLFDLEATNELLTQAAHSPVAAKYSLAGPTRLIAAKQWPCVEALSACAKKYDKAFGSLSEIVTLRRHVYDEVEPVPLSTRKHWFVRLSNMTKIGNEETRALAYKSLVQAHIVRVQQGAFSEQAEVGIVSEVEGPTLQFVSSVRSTHGKAMASGAKGLVPIVGASHQALRRQLAQEEKGQGEGFCRSKTCSIGEMARELANVLAICNAKEVFPPAKAADRDEWVTRQDVTNMMVADLRILHRNY